MADGESKSGVTASLVTCHLSLRLDAAFPDKGPVAQVLFLHQAHEAVGRALGRGLRALPLELAVQRRLAQAAHDVAVELLDDAPWRALGRDDARPAVELGL